MGALFSASTVVSLWVPGHPQWHKSAHPVVYLPEGICISIIGILNICYPFAKRPQKNYQITFCSSINSQTTSNTTYLLLLYCYFKWYNSVVKTSIWRLDYNWTKISRRDILRWIKLVVQITHVYIITQISKANSLNKHICGTFSRGKSDNILPPFGRQLQHVHSWHVPAQFMVDCHVNWSFDPIQTTTPYELDSYEYNLCALTTEALNTFMRDGSCSMARFPLASTIKPRTI